jgi:cold shock CspA family protein
LPFLCRHPSFSVSGSASALDGVSLQEGQKISYEEQRDAKRGKSSAENLKAL